jgi:predicted extracellular nuclease
MFFKIKTTVYGILCFALILPLGMGFKVQGAGDKTIVGLFEAFDDATHFSVTSGAFFSDAGVSTGYDFFGISDGAGGGDFGGDPVPHVKAYTGFTGGFLTGMDLDGEGGPTEVVLEWTGVDISSLTNLKFSGDFAEYVDGTGNIDASDYIRVEVQIDGGGYQNILEFRGSGTNTLFQVDTNGDNIGDGAALGGAAKTFSAPLATAGSTLDLRLTVRVDAGDEDFGIDNLTVESDYTLPAIDTLNPADDASDVPVEVDLTIQFDEEVKKGSGDITVKKLADDSLVESIDVTSANVSVSGTTVTIDLSSDLENSTDYYVEIDSGAFQDLVGNDFCGVSGNTSWNFTTTTAIVTPIFITEIMYDPNSAEDNWEWVEVYNPGDSAVDLSGYVIDDNNTIAHSSANIGPGMLGPGASGVLYNADDLTAEEFGAAWGTVNLIPVTDWTAMGLNNSGDQVSLWDSFASYSGDHTTHVNAIDTVNYSQGGFPDPVGKSIYLTDLNADNNVSGNWAESTDGVSTPLFDGYTSLAQGGNVGTDVGSPGQAVWRLLVSEVVVAPTEGEFIEIYNPNSVAIDLSDVYLTDATYSSGGEYYFKIVTGADTGGGSYSDFLARFPDGASIDSGGYQTVALAGSDDFYAAYGVDPTYELYEDGATADGIPDMREGLAGTINDQGGLSNNGEVVILFYWDGVSDLVIDLDYFIWGDEVEAVDKSGVAIDGPDADSETSSYKDDVAVGSQDEFASGLGQAHPTGESAQRDDLNEGAEIKTGGNGAQGHDETSEDLPNTWCTYDPTPNLANMCLVGQTVIVRPSVPSGWSFYEEIATGSGDFTPGPATPPLGRGSAEMTVDASGSLLLGTLDYAGVRLDEIKDLAYSTYRSTPDGSLYAPSLQFDIDYDLGDADTSWQGSLVYEPSNDGTVLDDSWQTWNPLKGSWWASDAPGSASCPISAPCTWSEVLSNFPNAGLQVDTGFLQFKAGGPWPLGFNGNVDAFAIQVNNQLTTYDFEPDVYIHDVQGSGSATAFEGQTVNLFGVVVGDFQEGDADAARNLRGFYVQEEDSDADTDPLTSEGIFVYDGNSPAVDVNVGDLVSVTGTATEYYSETEITANSVLVISSGNPLPSAAEIDLPVAGAIQNADGSWIPDLEAYEGMLAHFPDTLSVAEMFNLDRFGEIKLAEGDRPVQFTEDHALDVAGYLAHLKEVAIHTVMMDDGLSIQDPDPIIYPDGSLDSADSLRMGDTLTGLTGVVRYSRGSGGYGDETYRVMPTVAPSFVSVNVRQAAPDSVDGRLKVSSFNVLNFFTTLGSRGANDIDEFNRQLEKLVTALSALDADVVGLMEIENNYGDGAGSAIATLVEALNERVGEGVYAYIDPGVAQVGDDEIAVAFIYKVDTVEMAPGTTVEILDDSDLPALGLGGLAPLFTGDSTSRAALAVTFLEKETREVFTVSVNHFKSKGASALDGACNPPVDPNCDQLDGQGYWNARRTDTAQALAAWLATDPTGSRDPDFLIIGDLNAYEQEDPVSQLKSDGYASLQEAFATGQAYSYVFDAQIGTLDHAMANASLASQVSGLTEWHINADEADALDYNLDFGRNAAIFDGAIPYRASDHDPVVVGLNLNAPAQKIYEEDFETPAGGEWGCSTIQQDVTPSGRGFLGQFGNQTVCLNLDNLPYHNWVTVSFDVYVIRSWNGNVVAENGATIGPDKWQLDADGQTLLLTTFANYQGHDQAYPGWHPGSSYPRFTGALEVNTLGYTDNATPMDSVYRLSFTFLHSGVDLKLDFSATGLQLLSNESWGLDNVNVQTLASLQQIFLPLLAR